MSLPPPSLPSDPAYRTWRANHVYMCGKSSPVDLQGEKTERIRRFTNTYRDPDVLLAFTKFRDAFFLKFPERPLRWSRLRGLETLTFDAAAGLRIKDWRAAQDLGVEAESQDEMRRTSALLGESYGGGKFTFEAFVAAALTDGARGLSTLGYGPRLARLKMNSILLQIGGVPYMADERLTLPRSDYARSKKLFLDLLARCTSLYLDPKSPVVSSSKSACGFRESK